MMGMHNSKQS